MNNASTPNEPNTAEILRWFDEAGLTVAVVHAATCSACATPAAA